MARNRRNQIDLDFAFFTYLRIFYNQNRGRIKTHFRAPTKKFLDFNDPKSGAYLWEPQFEALEMYVFIKEYLNNRHVHEIFTDWHAKQNGFENRDNIEGLFGSLDTDQYTSVFEYIEKFKRNYPNYIFALPMGTGKTYLMATCIFYEFILANKYPDDLKYCHNALVFAPDKTVLQSLKKIQTVDKSLVVPAEYTNFLSSNVRFHFLEEAGTALSTIDQSQFNIIISNTQKIILKRQHAEKSASDRLFRSGAPTYEPGSVYDEAADLYDFDVPEKDDELATNQRFLKLTRLGQLGIYVDEAHHAFGNKLAADMGIKKTNTSLRLTIDELAANLGKAETRVCACYNFTGTPYVGNRVLPEVVYGYGLKEAIDKNFLKKMKRHSYTNPRSSEFVKLVIAKFWEDHKEQRYEGMLPKLAFFAPTIDELQNELRPSVETALNELNITTSRILVNVGDDRITTNDELREFNNLDTPGSEKQFILLVNKGKEGWDCRSLFGVALYRKPKSKIFVLQASMRCLRQIGVGQQTGHIYLSEENTEILEDELQQNFRVSVDELEGAGTNKNEYKVKVNKPPVKVKLQRIRRMHRLVEKQPENGLYMGLDRVDTENYRLIYTLQEGFSTSRIKKSEDLSEFKERREFSQLTLCAEIARYLNRSPLEIEDILTNSQEGMEVVLQNVNEFNELLSDVIIPRVFDALYDLQEYEHHEPEVIELVKEPEDGYYKVTSTPELVFKEDDDLVINHQDKSFHLDTYAFDSQPERSLFWSLLTEGKVKKVYFTGMLTHGQSDFYIQYIDPESHAVRRYYPDFLMQKDDDSWVIVEVKGDNKIDDKIVLAKADATQQRASASDMSYKIIKGSEARDGRYSSLLE
ncbi:MAG: DEAD/DEAH box helicase family protein [Candidatus Poribacteria bacterium]|nr:DEAD/DEAH box helicase family protein [Candidatus Poribacteria bacterium]